MRYVPMPQAVCHTLAVLVQLLVDMSSIPVVSISANHVSATLLCIMQSATSQSPKHTSRQSKSKKRSCTRSFSDPF